MNALNFLIFPDRHPCQNPKKDVDPIPSLIPRIKDSAPFDWDLCALRLALNAPR